MVNLKDLDVNRFLTLMFKNILFLLLFAACVHKCVLHSACAQVHAPQCVCDDSSAFNC